MRLLEIKDGSSLSADLDGNTLVYRRKGDRQTRAEFLQMLEKIGKKDEGILRGLAK